MRRIWILVADAGRARILSKIEGIKRLSLVQAIDNPLGRARNMDLVTDHPGRLQKGGSGVMSDMDPRTDPHEQKAIEFAHQLNKLLYSAAIQGEYGLLAVIAPAHFLGLLRAGMKPATNHRMVLHQANDFTHLTLSELELRLGDVARYHYAEVAQHG
jgi:protein required for attachment to host cells